MVGLGRIGVPVHLRDNVSTFLRLKDAFNPTVTYLNLNSLLVKRQIDNPSPGAVTGGN